ncbi:hypothetical protein MRS76_20400 [Rhizobiaceae bacterium n13]|uniref:hypothetical protein n=1 Tax=Ferirhizobium litorale TaxID=2927786 RepID=UPI0024B298CA|nr:hypothetical protein [Fererhizobium litorale]MDI7864303.1 hypothetical protein [Fererhizobium litorale]
MSTKIGIAFVKGGIIPASILKKDKDVHVAPHEAIEVPAAYGQHLIDDKFAYAKAVEKVAKSGKKESAAPEIPVDSANHIAAAEKAVADAEAKLAAAGDDEAAKAAATLEVDEAAAALKKLKG